MKKALVVLLMLVAPGAAALDWPNRVRGVTERYVDGDVDERVEAIEALEGIAPDEAAELLETGLSDRNARVRTAAATMSGALRADMMTDALVGALSDRNAEVRIAACGALAALRDPQLVDVLARSLSDRDADVRQAAIEALARLGAPDAVVAIVGALQDSDRDVVAAALVALGQLGQPWTLYPILERVHDPVQDVALAAIEAVSSLHAPEAIPALVELVQTGRPEVAVAAVDALGVIGSRGATSALVGQVVAPRVEGIRASAIAALVAVADPRSAELLAPHVAGLGDALHPVFAVTAPRSWDAAPTDGARNAALRARLAAGDPSAVEVVTGMQGSPDELGALYALSPTPDAFCRRTGLRSLDASNLAETVEQALRVDAVDCLDAAIVRDDPPVDDPLLVILLASSGSAVGLERARSLDFDTLDIDLAGWLASSLADVDGGTELLVRMLASEHAAVRYEAALALAERTAPWLDEAELASLESAAIRRPEVLTALTGQLDGPLGDRVAALARRLATSGPPDTRSEALSLLALRCESASAEMSRSALASDDLWLRRAGARLASRCGYADVLAASIDVPSRVVRALALSSLEDPLLALRVGDASGSSDERVAALDELCSRGSELCAQLAELHLHSRDAAVAAASWLALASADQLPDADQMLLVAAASDRAVERGAILLAAYDRLDEAQRAAADRLETHPAVARVVASGRDAFDAELTLAFVDAREGRPMGDQPVFVAWDDGRFAIVRSDGMGRVVLRGRDVAFAVHVNAGDADPMWPAR